MKNAYPLPAAITRVRALLGTYVAIEVAGGPAAELERAIEDAYAAIARVGVAMHPHAPGSDLARLHRLPVGTPVAVDPWTYDCLGFALELYRASDGLFDPVVPGGHGDAQALTLVERDVIRREAPIEIDLGGVAKGYAVDRAIEALRGRCADALVNAGGDLRAFGAARELRVRIDGHDHACVVRDAALAVSDYANVTRPPEHRGYYARGRAVSAPRDVVVGAGTAVVADAMTKVVLAAESDDVRALLARYGAVVRQPSVPAPGGT